MAQGSPIIKMSELSPAYTILREPATETDREAASDASSLANASLQPVQTRATSTCGTYPRVSL